MQLKDRMLMIVWIELNDRSLIDAKGNQTKHVLKTNTKKRLKSVIEFTKVIWTGEIDSIVSIGREMNDGWEEISESKSEEGKTHLDQRRLSRYVLWWAIVKEPTKKMSRTCWGKKTEKEKNRA